MAEEVDLAANSSAVPGPNEPYETCTQNQSSTRASLPMGSLVVGHPSRPWYELRHGRASSGQERGLL